jgi:hypothetical protein
MFAEEANKRRGTRTDLVEQIPPSSFGKARDQVGALFGVSGRYVEAADSQGSFELPRPGLGHLRVARVGRE